MTGVLLTLHILVFVIAFAFTAGVGILSARVARSGDASVIHGVFVAARPLQWVGGIGWFVSSVGIGMGFCVVSIGYVDVSFKSDKPEADSRNGLISRAQENDSCRSAGKET